MERRARDQDGYISPTQKRDCKGRLGDLVSRAAAKMDKTIGENLLAKKILSDNEFHDRIGHILPAAVHEMAAPPNKQIRDTEFKRISELLTMWGKPKWAIRPRTFVVLHMTGMQTAMDAFVEDSRSDFFLPYKKENLPDVLTGVQRERFLGYQHNVLTGRGDVLERGNGEHQNFDRQSADTMFWYVRPLGKGMAGFQTQVDCVIGRRTLREFALKKIARASMISEDQQRMKVFTNELDILKSLSHRHIVQLQGSYTDRDCVGLLMYPVADMNLAGFLTRSLGHEEHSSRKVSIRCFFGCIAVAIDYLHNNGRKTVRHKDIKPENILVKRNKVYVSDFGTSHAWAGDVSGTTEGTQNFFTRKYLSPEALFDARGKPSDIWSLGCVFLEMCTVLANRSFDDIASFFSNNGTGKRPYYQNQEAMVRWTNELKQVLGSSDVPQDKFVLELVLLMCRREPSERIEAQDLVRRILEFEAGNLYHCSKCSQENMARASKRKREDHDMAPSFSIDRVNSQGSIDWDGTLELDESDDELSFANLYHSPTVEETETTIRALCNEVPRNGNHILEEVTERVDSQTTNNNTLNVGPVDSVNGNLGLVEKASTIADTSHVSDNRSAQKYNNPTIRPSDSRAIASSAQYKHDSVAGDGPSTLPPKPTIAPSANSRSRSYGVPIRATPTSPGILQPLMCPWPDCEPPEGQVALLFKSIDFLRNHLRKQHNVHDLGWTQLQVNEDGCPPLGLTPASGAFTIVEQQVRGTDDEDNFVGVGERRFPKGVASTEQYVMREQPRFAEIPRDRRPEPVKPTNRPARPACNSPTVYSITAVQPDPPLLEATGAEAQDSSGIPATTFAPSYLLASKNRFTEPELQEFRQSLEKPLFVYGTLMFPSVLNSISQRFKTADGIYSSAQSRRLRTVASDWNGVGDSLQSAAEKMTPASLAGHEAFRVSNVALAYLKPALAGTSTKGFLLFGLSSEALACIDTLYENDGPQQLFQERDELRGNRKWDKEQMARKLVNVSLNTTGGKETTIEAWTYAISEAASSYSRKGPWDINQFIKGRVFNGALGGATGERLVSEELAIAATLKTKLLLLGDFLVARVHKNDTRGLETLLTERRYDPNAPSPAEGTALQAAARQGNLDIMRILVESGADVNARGGQYVTPLIAAVVANQFSAVKVLLNHGVRVYESGGTYVSALYQAVDFGHLDMVHALLEMGAWMTLDFNEVLDLAAERGDKEVRRELERYEIRTPRRRSSSKKFVESSSSPEGTNHNERNEQNISPTSNSFDGTRNSSYKMDLDRPTSQSLGAQLAIEALKLHGSRGKWTGVKGVKMLQIAVDNGVSPDVIMKIRPYAHDWPKVQNLLASGVEGHLGNRMMPAKHTDLLSVQDDGDREHRRRRDSGTATSTSRRRASSDTARDSYESRKADTKRFIQNTATTMLGQMDGKRN